MKIIKIKELEDCFGGSFIKEVLLNEAVTKEFIYYLGGKGVMQYFPSFARPFYVIDIPERCIIKGGEGNKTLRIILNRNTIEKSLKYFHNLVIEYKRGGGENVR